MPTVSSASPMPTSPASSSGRRPSLSMKAMAMKVAATLTPPTAQVVAVVCASGVEKPAEAKIWLA